MKQLTSKTALVLPTTPANGDGGTLCLGSEASGW